MGAATGSNDKSVSEENPRPHFFIGVMPAAKGCFKYAGALAEKKTLHNELFDVFGGDYLERCIRVGSVETFRTFHVGLTFVPFELKRT